MAVAKPLHKLFDKGLIWRAESLSAGSSSAESVGDEFPSKEGLTSEDRREVEKVFTGKPLSAELREIAAEQKKPALAAEFGIREIDSLLPHGGLQFGALHEWFFLPAGEKNEAPYSQTAPLYPHTIPPCSILSVLAGSALKKTISALLGEQQAGKNVLHDALSGKTSFKKFIIWIGRDLWPSPHMLFQSIHAPVLEYLLNAEKEEKQRAFLKELNFLSSCIFVDPPDKQLSLWCIESALRSPSVLAVIAAPQKLAFTLGRRFSLAAQKGNVMALFVRPHKQSTIPSSAMTRWMLETVPSPSLYPRWKLELLKLKGSGLSGRNWIFEMKDDVDSTLARSSSNTAGDAGFHHSDVQAASSGGSVYGEKKNKKISLALSSDVAHQPHREKEDEEQKFQKFG